MNMDTLISVINKLHDVFNVVGTNSVLLPQIVVIGSQSSGKSSVLESLVGRNFLPRGTGIVTRCPLILQLIYAPKATTVACTEGKTLQVEEWAQFLHIGDKIFTDFSEIRKEIETEMNKKGGTKKGISSEAINLKIFSPNLINLTLVDLPGITKVPVGEQPKDIEFQVKKLILQYIKNPNAIILAVTAANTDFPTSEAIKLARECDPEGFRTLAVITKLDLMDAGTDASEVIHGRVIPVRLGIIGVVNRSQQDIIDNKSINDSLKDELQFLQRNYPTLASRNGTEYLRKRLNKLLINHIKECLPNLKNRVNNMISQYQAKMHSYGNIVTDPNRVLLQFIHKFASYYCSSLEGTSRNIETSELSGGARICYIFHEVFGRTLRTIDPLGGLTYWDILTAIRNAAGTRPAFFVPEVAFELLVKRQIQRLEEPSLRCVELVHEEMQRIVHHCGAEFQQEIRRFPKLHEKILDVVTQLLQQRLPATNTMVENLIAIELAYVNTHHPDFFHQTPSNYSDEKKKDNDLSRLYSTEKTVSVHPSSKIKSALEENFSEPLSFSYEVKENSAITDMTIKENDESLDGDFIANDYQNWLKRVPEPILGELTDENYRTPQTGTLSTYSERWNGTQTYDYERNLTEVQSKECQIIEHFIRSYFSIVKKSIQDAVPKAIMHFLVNYVKENLQSELVTHLYKPDYFDSLLQESQQIVSGRKDAFDMLQALKKSNDIIREIRDISL